MDFLRSRQEFFRFFYLAKGSAGGLKTQLYIAKEIGYLDAATHFDLNKRTEKISGMLGNLIKAIKGRKQAPVAFLAFAPVSPIYFYLSRVSRI